MRKLISFDVTLKHDICTETCKSLKKTTAVLTFKISENQSSAGYTIKSVECSLDELRKFKD
jgi:hypothetical protein